MTKYTTTADARHAIILETRGIWPFSFVTAFQRPSDTVAMFAQHRLWPFKMEIKVKERFHRLKKKRLKYTIKRQTCATQIRIFLFELNIRLYGTWFRVYSIVWKYNTRLRYRLRSEKSLDGTVLCLEVMRGALRRGVPSGFPKPSPMLFTVNELNRLFRKRDVDTCNTYVRRHFHTRDGNEKASDRIADAVSPAEFRNSLTVSGTCEFRGFRLRRTFSERNT